MRDIPYELCDVFTDRPLAGNALAYDNGPHYVYVELETPDAIAALTPDLSRLAALGSTAFCVFARKAAT